MPFAPDDYTLAADHARLRNHLNQVAVVTENDPRQGPAGSATSVSLAWGTLKTAVTALTSSVVNANRMQDFLDHAPTLSYRGTP